jgi:hypothetical protein
MVYTLYGLCPRQQVHTSIATNEQSLLRFCRRECEGCNEDAELRSPSIPILLRCETSNTGSSMVESLQYNNQTTKDY